MPKVDGSQVKAARDEQDAVEIALRKRPDLILIGLGGLLHDVIMTARYIREHAALGENVPVVIFYMEDIREGDEVPIGQNIYVTRPDNFNQLRNVIARLLHQVLSYSLI